MVSVVQLVEHRIVVPSVVGSSPITHPSKKESLPRCILLFSGPEAFFKFQMQNGQSSLAVLETGKRAAAVSRL